MLWYENEISEADSCLELLILICGNIFVDSWNCRNLCFIGDIDYWTLAFKYKESLLCSLLFHSMAPLIND